MMELIDFEKVREHSIAEHELGGVLRQLIGQPFLCFRISYGDELTIHLGELRAFPTSKAKRLWKGSYVLSARASSWLVRPASKPFLFAGTAAPPGEGESASQTLDIREVESRRLIDPGSIVVRAQVLPSPGAFGLALGFADRSLVMIVPDTPQPSANPGEETADDIADWELFTPYHRYLRVGPGLRWAYLADDQPMSE